MYMYSLLSVILGPLDTLDIDSILCHLPKWTHLPQSADMLHAQVYCVVNLLLSRESTDTETDANVVVCECGSVFLLQGSLI